METASQAPVTIRSLAKELGLSKSAVSAAMTGKGTLNPATRQMILAAARERGFEPNSHAQRLSSGRFNKNICLFALWLDFGVNTSKLQVIQGLLVAEGYDVPIYGLGLNEVHDESRQASLLAAVRRQKPRALVCVTRGLAANAVEELRKYQFEGGTLVCYDSPVDLDCDRVQFDAGENTYLATRHLLQQGHRKVAFAHHGFVRYEGERLAGYRRALAEFGVQERADWILQGEELSNYAAGGARLARTLLHMTDRPTAVAVVNDYAAMAMLGELQQAGVQCPRDLSVAGHDDHALSAYFPVPLTTVSHPAEGIGHAVVALLNDRLTQQYTGAGRVVSLGGELVVRASSAPPQESR